MFFDANTVAPSAPMDAIPAGDYEAMVTASQIKQTKDGSGRYLELTLEIQSGQFQGRKLWDRLNVQNRNQQAVEIAQRQLSGLCHAVGVLQLPNDATPLHNKPMVVKVAAKNDPERGMANEVKGYKAKAQTMGMAPAFTAPRVAAPQQPAANPAPAFGQATPPWAAAAG